MNYRYFSQLPAFLVGILLLLMLAFSSLSSRAQGLGQSGISVLGSGSVLVTATPVRQFYVRNYSGKCLDFGAPPQVAGGPVFLYGCNSTIAQQVRVVEVNDRHEVRLYLGNKVLGVKQSIVVSSGLVATAAAPVADIPLELQDEANLLTVFSRNQIFALDGDSIIWAANRKLVVKVQNARGANRTPLVVGQRKLSDEEFWDFVATDGSDAPPTTGFVSVPNERDHRATPTGQFVNTVQAAKWGTVIEVVADLSLTDLPPVTIPAGVTIRGNRRNTLLGPELSALNKRDQASDGMLAINGEQVRITGLRLRGPSRSTDEDIPNAVGILAPDNFPAILDHNDISDWSIAAIKIADDDDSKTCQINDHRPNGVSPARVENVQVVRNFIHHNRRQERGYGVVAGNGAYPYIEGNTFLSNRHAIAADGKARTGYQAFYNLVLADAPEQEKLGGIYTWHTQDFDMHGTNKLKVSIGVYDWEIAGFGGTAGESLEIAWNTFLGTNRNNFELRGEPCFFADFHHNVSLRSSGDAVDCAYCDGGINKLRIAPTNQFNSANPTNRLAVGDFDGDGREDLFLATGAAWYYAPAGNAEWRFLSAQSDKIDNLLLGDFDGDGVTDVFTQHGYNWDVSWGGRSKWETINVSGNILGNAAIGDFDGDHRADVFYADGQHWYISYGGNSPFTYVNDSSFRVPDLRFGDFNGDGKTDVFGVGAKYWQVSYSATGSWTALQPRLTDTATNLRVADFNGDGRADIVTTTVGGGLPPSVVWKVSYAGMGSWTTLRTDSYPYDSVAAIGRFDGNRSVDLLLWHDNYLDIAASGAGVAQRQSRQDMR